MGLENGKWRVSSGDCLWNIASSVYSDGNRWRDIANANGISQSTALIYPGQLLTLPSISSSTTTTTTNTSSKKVTIDWFKLDSGTLRSMFVTWSHSYSGTDGYEVIWEYDNEDGSGWRTENTSTVTIKQSSYTAPESAKKVRVSIKPVSDDWTDGVKNTVAYDYSNNPPEVPPIPSFNIDNKNVLTLTINNIQTTINADEIEIAIYKDNTLKYKTGKATIDIDARYVNYTCDVDEGHSYKVRCRAVRGTIYGGYTDFTDTIYSLPVAPEKITNLISKTINEQQSTQYAILAEWEESNTANSYIVEFSKNIDSLGTVLSSTQTTQEGEGSRLLIPGIDIGFEYFFRVASINEKGQSLDWSEISSVTLGIKPSAPTTYSNNNSCVIGEDLKLYWIHNSKDGSYESYARLAFSITDSANPDNPPMEIIKVIENTRPEETKGETSVYVINTDDPDWTTVGEGYVIKWKVQTAGVTSEYSDYSTEREVVVHTQPELEIDLLNNVDISVDEINIFPFYISVSASPPAQTPISYYVEVISNNTYNTVDSVGKNKTVNIGDKIYYKHYDPLTNPWQFLLEMSPNNIDLENDISYTINVTVTMNSGLTVKESKDFIANLTDLYYNVDADILINEDSVEASIHPYCYEYINDVKTLVNNCTLSVYRKEYDGTFVLIAENIDNDTNTYITDPHPSLDYGRYRVVAKMSDTGAISYGDVNPVSINIKSAILQWAEEWYSFNVDDNGTGNVEPSWSGSMVKIPYNINISDSKAIDKSLVEYVGREQPVSYYGTHIGETSTWSMVIPKEDKQLLYDIRRLSRWKGDVYVREPYGTGYWANISLSYNISYSNTAVSVSISLTRVEGGM